MPDRDLILGVLGVQAGFVTPTQVMTAASTWLVHKDGLGLLDELERSGALTHTRRRLLEKMVDAAVAVTGGNELRALEELGGERAVKSTFGDLPPLPEPARHALADAERAVPEERPGQYSRIEELGRGAQSVVWRAIDEFVGREVALKVLEPPADAKGEAVRARFLREARLVAQLDHPGIAAVHELARRPDGTLFCAQKLVRGQTLKARLSRCASLSERLALLDSLVGACNAVAYAHSRNVIHRDLKPSNIMVGDFGETVVVDWGLAKRLGSEETTDTAARSSIDPQLTTVGSTLGTPSYMSPEQARGAVAEIDERSDVFSLGVVLYQLLTGRLPFEGLETSAVIDRVLAGEFPAVREVSPDAPAELAAVAHRALSGDKSARYAGATELAAELTAYRAGGRVRAYDYPSWELLRRFILRNRALTSVSALAVLVLIGAAAIIATQLHRTRVSLATSLLERAHAAEANFEWGRAAAYYAASRVQSDSREGQWGFALARAKLLPRVLARPGAVDSALTVARLPDGRAILVGKDGQSLVAHDLKDDRELWRVPVDAAVTSARFTDGGVLFVVESSKEAEVMIDPTNGSRLGEFNNHLQPCEHGPLSRHIEITASTAPAIQELVADAPEGGRRNLVRAQLLHRVCAVSPDGSRLAVVDQQGTVHVWDLATLDEIATHSASDVREVFYSPHGVVLVRSRSLEVIAGPDGDFFVPLGSAGTGLMSDGAIGAMSPDGNLLALPRLDAPQVDMVDLRTRTVVSSLTFPPGSPRLTFSMAGDRLYVAGLLGNSYGAAWALRQHGEGPTIPGAPRMAHVFASEADRVLVKLILDPYRLEVRTLDGKLISTLAVPGRSANASLSRDGQRFAVYSQDTVSIHDASTGAVLGKVDCAGCVRLELGEHTFITSNGQEITLWSTERLEPIWRENERVGPLYEPLSISPDERTAFWGRNGTLYMHTLGSEPDREIHINDIFEDARPSHDGTRLLVVGKRELGVWDLATLRPIFRTYTTSPVAQDAMWARDDSAIIHNFDSVVTNLVDPATGKVFAHIATSKPATFRANDRLSPDLRHALARGGGTWEPYEIPPPDTSPPSESLARVLAEAGLEMDGVELVYSSSSVFQ